MCVVLQMIDTMCSVVALNSVRAHPLSRAVYDVIITYLITELHSGNLPIFLRKFQKIGTVEFSFTAYCADVWHKWRKLKGGHITQVLSCRVHIVAEICNWQTKMVMIGCRV